MDGLETEYENGVLRAVLSGEIDHHVCAEVREEIDREFFKNSPKKLILDLTGIQFMDSSGLGLIMGRYSRCVAAGCEFVLCGIDERSMRILKMSGMDKVLKIKC